MKHTFAVPFLLLGLLAVAAPASAQRLPDTVQAEHYRLWFAPNLADATFRGRTTIDVRLTRASKAITLHAAELAFQRVSITAGGRARNARVAMNGTAETAILQVDEEIPAGAATIEIEYTGVLNEQLRGFYISRANGRKYAVTQMEATDARRAFPSFDEPAYKATFDLTAVVDKADTAISNGRVLSDQPGPDAGVHTITFAPTPRMSTYLVALIVGDFQCRADAVEGIAVRVCATADKLPRTAFALETAKQQLSFYNRYFGIKYPFGKLDLIAIPDFAAGAMENAGAITFRERLLLLDPARSSLGTKKQVGYVVAHEIAHQWFGNLVTMKWWDDIWLNEGFATWIATSSLASQHADWHFDIDETLATQEALDVDALRSTRAIRTKAETPAEINQLFDSIAYEKTAAVLRMIESYVGVEPFRQGIRAYLEKHAYGNATGEDFWNELTRVTGKPVDAIMKSFVDKPGAPVVKSALACRDKRGDITLRQEPFSSSAGATASPAPWTLPVCIRSQKGAARCEVISQPEQTVQASSCSAVINAGARGYYFSEYARDDLRALGRDLTWLRPVERLNLLGDEWWMVQGGRHDVGEYLDLATAVAFSDTPGGIETIVKRLSSVSGYMVPDADRPRFEVWVRSRFGPLLQLVGLPGSPRDNDDVQLRRSALATLLGVIGNDNSVQTRARAMTDAYLANSSAVAPTMVQTVLQIAAQRAGPDLYDQYEAKLQTLTAQPEEYYRFLNALPFFQHPELTARTLELALSPNLRTQDTAPLLAGVLGRPWGSAQAWDYIRAHWSELTQKLGNFQGIPTIIDGLGNFCSATAAAQVRQFFKEHPTPAAERALAQAIERIESCAVVRQRQEPALSRWMETFRP